MNRRMVWRVDRPACRLAVGMAHFQVDKYIGLCAEGSDGRVDRTMKTDGRTSAQAMGPCAGWQANVRTVMLVGNRICMGRMAEQTAGFSDRLKGRWTG